MTGIGCSINDGQNDNLLDMSYEKCGKWTYYNANSGSIALPSSETWGFGLKLNYSEQLFMVIFISGSNGKIYYAVYNNSWGCWHTI
jgi:hypothetical protein